MALAQKANDSRMARALKRFDDVSRYTTPAKATPYGVMAGAVDRLEEDERRVNGGRPSVSGVSWRRRRQEPFVQLDADQMRLINAYYNTDECVQACRKMLYSMSFKGGVDLVWGTGEYTGAATERNLTDESRRELVHVLQQALDYHAQFGCVAVRVERGGGGGQRSPASFRVLPPSAGKFYFRYVDGEQLEMYFVPRAATASNSSGTQFTGPASLLGVDGAQDARQLSALLDPDVHVFVWPSHRNRYSHDGSIATPLWALYGHALKLNEVRENALDADFNSTHPTLYVERETPALRPVAEMTEREQYPDNVVQAGRGVTDAEEMAYTRTAVREEAAFSRLRALRDAQLADPSLFRSTIDYGSSRARPSLRRRTWEDNLFMLDENDRVRAHQSPNETLKLEDREVAYYRVVCMGMGVPVSFVLGRSSVKLGMSASTDDRETVRASVNDTRDAASTFMDWVYAKMYHDDDVAYITGLFVELQALEASHGGGDDEDALEIRRRKATLSTIAHAPSRVRLMFSSDPMTESIDEHRIASAMESNAFTPLEEVNMMRSWLGHERVDESHPAVKERQLARDMKHRQEEAALKAAEAQAKQAALGPAAGGGAAAKPKKAAAKDKSSTKGAKPKKQKTGDDKKKETKKPQ